MRTMSKWSGCLLAIVCLTAAAEAPKKDAANDGKSAKAQVVSLSDPGSLKPYIDAHRGL